jgi:peptidoglycan/xylan/chitin deacetylase (PgdA/CDA1 family)
MLILTEKRELAARIFGSIGISRLLESAPKRKILIVLNYHRVGIPSESPYDPGVFSANADQFDWQIGYLKRRFQTTTLEEAVAMACGNMPIRTCVLITFDDGYLDNYNLAFPILRSHGVQGVFFLPTSLVGTNHLPWWDVIAYIIKNSRKDIVHLQYPRRMQFDLPRQGVTQVISSLLQVYKSPEMRLQDRFITDLASACEVSVPFANAERCIMNWQEARQMQNEGMAFGSHTHTHEILSKLSVARQSEEVCLSRGILEAELNRRIDVLAYPVGGRDCFTRDTIGVLRSNGYRAAFSFYGGFNRPGEVQPFDILRVGVGPQSHQRFRLKLALATFTGTQWF